MAIPAAELAIPIIPAEISCDDSPIDNIKIINQFGIFLNLISIVDAVISAAIRIVVDRVMLYYIKLTVT